MQQWELANLEVCLQTLSHANKCPDNGCALQGRKWYARYYQSSVAIPSPEFEQVCAVARDNNVLLCVGIIEKDGGTLYCTNVLLDREGQLLSKHRKASSSVPSQHSPHANSPSSSRLLLKDWSGVVEQAMDFKWPIQKLGKWEV